MPATVAAAMRRQATTRPSPGRRAKAARIAAILDERFPAPLIPLRHGDPFTLLVAVLLSAQCTDERVNRVTPDLFALASTPAAMAAVPVARIRSIIRPCGLSPQKSKALARMPESEILKLIRSCGLAPSKARNLKRLAQTLVAEYGGKVPRDMEELEKLPGVGHKTASVVMTQAFGEPAFPVDTHIHRLARRWGLSKAKDVKQTERDLKKLFSSEEWGKRHLQLIYFGREHCPARQHDPGTCPICAWA